MSESQDTSTSGNKICKIVIQQCLTAQLRFDTEDPPLAIGPGMVVFVCFLQGANMERLDSIVKAVLNAKLCESPTSGGQESSAGRESVVHHKLNILVIPQATLGGKLKGKGIQYHGLVAKSLGEELFLNFVQRLKETVEAGSDGGGSDSCGRVESGVYGARQILSMETNGPFTHVFEF